MGSVVDVAALAQIGWQALHCVEAAGHWWAGLVQEADGCEALWGPGVNAGPLVRRAGSGVGGCRAGGTGSSVHLLVGRSSS